MKEPGCRLEQIPWQHPLLGSADFVPNRSCGDQKGELIDKQNSVKLTAFTLYRASRRHAPYGGTRLVDTYERLIKQFKPIPWSGNRWIDHIGNYIHAAAPKEKLNLGDRKMESLRKIWQAWKRFGQVIGDFIGRLVLTVFYFTLFMPFALGVRLFGDPLAIRSHSRAKWLERRTQDLTLDDSRRLF